METESVTDIEALRTALVELVATKLTPIARRYGYGEEPLETSIRWRPLVLVLGNYSSGKSTLINELLGYQVQATGQAPTDDSFTVIAGDGDGVDGGDGGDGEATAVVEEREGRVLLTDPQYPFTGLRRYGQRFAAHFRLKKVRSPLLAHLAIIDTPGMLDSVAEAGRGYDYQRVVGDLAEMADLVLVLFDPHKAGTVRETYDSLRETLPMHASEDRVVFVMNRIDECGSLPDLLRVYGTLCWNLSQMLGRKDIPPVLLTHSPAAATTKPAYLGLLGNQQGELRRLVSEAPRRRLDHLVQHAERHGERLRHLAEALAVFLEDRRRTLLRSLGGGLLVALALGLVVTIALTWRDDLSQDLTKIGIGISVFVLTLALWAAFVTPSAIKRAVRRMARAPDELTPLLTREREESWKVVRPLVLTWLEGRTPRPRRRDVRRDLRTLDQLLGEDTVRLRAMLDKAGAARG